MGRTRPDLSAWMEPVPRWAELAWVLPASGGRVIVRGYDESRTVIHDDELPSPWVIDEALVPLASGQSEDTYGPGGVVYRGDCVVYLGWDDRPKPRAWAPQRVVAVEPGPSGWQRVWSVAWVTDDWYDDEVPDWERTPVVPAAAIPRRLRKEQALHGNDRRRVLELFGLNLECGACGGHGQEIWYGTPIDPMPPNVPYRDGPRQPWDPVYECGCTATWSVGSDGELTLREPLPRL